MNSSPCFPSLSASWLLWRHIEESQQVRGSRGHPLGAEHTHCDAACQALALSQWHSQPCRGVDPISTLHTLHSGQCSVPSVDIYTSPILSLSVILLPPKAVGYLKQEWSENERSILRKQSKWKWRDRKVYENGKRDGGWKSGMEDYHGPCCPPGSVWHQFEPSCQWVLIMEDWQHCMAAGS